MHYGVAFVKPVPDRRVQRPLPSHVSRPPTQASYAVGVALEDDDDDFDAVIPRFAKREFYDNDYDL